MYTLYVERIDTNGCFHTEYEIPVVGIENYDSVVKVAKRIAKSLKENYVISISKIERKHIGYIVGDKVG